jgi:hypothetical protein
MFLFLNMRNLVHVSIASYEKLVEVPIPPHEKLVDVPVYPYIRNW